MKPETLVRQFLIRKKAGQPTYSLRALARDIKVSPSFLSEVMNGKKKMPAKWIVPLSRTLQLDEITIFELKLSILQSHLKGTDLEALTDVQNPRVYSKVNLSTPLDQKKISVLSKWYYVVVLDFLTLEKNNFTEYEIGLKLGLSPAAVREAISVLKVLKLVKLDEKNILRKKDQHIRIPTSKTDPVVRGFHIQMIEKAKYELLKNTKDQDFERRLIAGTTMAVDPKHTQSIKKKLQAFMAEIAQEFSTGSAKEIYQLNLQLFPLTNDTE